MGLGTPSTSGCPIPWIPSMCSGLLSIATQPCGGADASGEPGQRTFGSHSWGRGPRGGWHPPQALAEADHGLLLLRSLDGARPEPPDLADGVAAGQVPLLAQVTGQQGARPAMAQHAVNCHGLDTRTRWVGGTAGPPCAARGTPWVTGDTHFGTASMEPLPGVTFPHPLPSSSQMCQPPEMSPGVTTLPQMCVPLQVSPSQGVIPQVVSLPQGISPSKVPFPKMSPPPGVTPDAQGVPHQGVILPRCHPLQSVPHHQGAILPNVPPQGVPPRASPH